jgi:hypothetical protein
MKLIAILVLISLINFYRCSNKLLIEKDDNLEGWYEVICNKYTNRMVSYWFPLVDVQNIYWLCPFDIKNNLLTSYPFARSLFILYGDKFVVLTYLPENKQALYPSMSMIEVVKPQEAKVEKKN